MQKSDGHFLRLMLARFLFLLGIYATGRFLLYFVSDRLGLDAGSAAEQAGNLLAALALVTVLASLPAGWLADKWGRRTLMMTGAGLGGLSALALIGAHTSTQILLFGGLMSLGSAAFSGGSWALLADLSPAHHAGRYFGLANFSTAGAAAAAGLFGPLMDWSERLQPGSGFTVLFILAALAFFTSALPIVNPIFGKALNVPETDGSKGRTGNPVAGLAVVPVPAIPPTLEEDQDPTGGAARL